MKLSISEILSRASKISDVDQRVTWLRANDIQPLRVVLHYALDPRIKWLLPETDPPYKPNQLVDQDLRLYTEVRRFYLFVEGGHQTLKQLKRETLFIEMLESLHPEDAKLILAAKNKKVPYEGITAEVVNAAFPGLIQA